MDSARHVIGCHITQTRGKRVQNAFEDVASTPHQSPPDAAISAAAAAPAAVPSRALA